MKTISFYTFGCRLNQSETAGIQNSLEASGFKVVEFGQPADVVVVNTCTVTENGDADTRRLVNKINRITPHARIALVGCQAQVQKEQLAGLANVRWIVGNARKMELARIFQEHPDPSSPQVITPTIDRKPFTLETTGVDRQHTRANLKIQDGCDFFCTFCEIPYARGRARSRVFEDVLLEARALAIAGHREIVLTGINIGTYQHEGKDFLDVIKALESIQELERIRVSSIEPTTIPLEFFDLMNTSPKLCRYLHIPLQSGSDDILKAMQRKYTRAEFIHFVREAKARVPQICVGTDVIVGFPGETDEHFEQTADLIRQEPVDYVHVFSYSERQMARSKGLEGKVSAGEIQKRSQILRELSQRKKRMYYGSLVGTSQSVLFEEFKDGYWNGLTDHYVRVHVRSDQELTNRIERVVLSQAQDHAVAAELEGV